MEISEQNILFLNLDTLERFGAFTAEEEDVLYRINQTVAAGNTLEEVIDLLFAEVPRIIPCDRIDVAFIEENGKRLVLHYVKSGYEPIFLKTGYASDIHSSPIQKIFQTGFPSIVNNLDRYLVDNPFSQSAKLLHEEGINSTMACPLMVEHRPVGLLIFRTKKKEAYAEREVMLQHSFAERLSQAVDKAYRLDQLSSTMQSYMEMLGFVSHEIKNPLASIITIGKTITSGYFGELDYSIKEMIERMVKKAEYLHNLTVEYLNLARFESGQLTLSLRSTDFIEDIFLPAVEIISHAGDHARTRINRNVSDNLPMMMADPDLLIIVMVNLLGNAVKYGIRDGEIWVSARVVDNRMRVTVWNEGPGFSENQKIKLFKKFSKLDSPE